LKSVAPKICEHVEHIATCLCGKHIPTERNVFLVMLEDSAWLPDPKNFLQRGGRVSDALSVTTDHTMRVDK